MYQIGFAQEIAFNLLGLQHQTDCYLLLKKPNFIIIRKLSLFWKTAIFLFVVFWAGMIVLWQGQAWLEKHQISILSYQLCENVWITFVHCCKLLLNCSSLRDSKITFENCLIGASKENPLPLKGVLYCHSGNWSQIQSLTWKMYMENDMAKNLPFLITIPTFMYTDSEYMNNQFKGVFTLKMAKITNYSFSL